MGSSQIREWTHVSCSGRRIPIHRTTRQVPVGLLDRKVLDGVRSSQWGWLSRRQFDLTSFFTHKAAARARSTRGATRVAQRSLSIPGPLPTKGCWDDTLGRAGSLHRGMGAPVQVPGVTFREALPTSSICRTPRPRPRVQAAAASRSRRWESGEKTALYATPSCSGECGRGHPNSHLVDCSGRRAGHPAPSEWGNLFTENRAGWSPPAGFSSFLEKQLLCPAWGYWAGQCLWQPHCMKGHAGSSMYSFNQHPNALVQRVLWQWACITRLMGAAFAKALLVFPLSGRGPGVLCSGWRPEEPGIPEASLWLTYKLREGSTHHPQGCFSSFFLFFFLVNIF